jgi:hypothetical protein
VGVSFSRTDNVNTNISYQVYFAETPPPYVGDTTAARAVFFIDDVVQTNPIPIPPTWIKWQGVGKLSDSWSAALNNGSGLDLVQVGDLIQFNHSGPYYVIVEVQFNTMAQLTEFKFEALPTDPHAKGINGAPRHLNSGPGPDGAWGVASVDDNGINNTDDVREIAWPGSDDLLKQHRFQIIRKPQRTTAGSLSLPNGTAVILGLSGFDGVISHDPMTSALIDDHHEFSAAADPDTSPVTIMFRPDGSVEQVFYSGTTIGILPDTPIHLLVGSAILDERLDPALSTPSIAPMPPPPAFARNQDPLLWQNLNDLNNLWVTIGHRTGSITTAQMQDWQVLYTAPPTDPDGDTLVRKTQHARALTASGQNVGGQ